MTSRPSVAGVLILAASVTVPGCRRARPWNVMLFIFDTTRADALGCCGKADAHTPNLDPLASEGFPFGGMRG